MAQKSLLGKLALVLVLAMAFLVPLMMVQSLVAERAGLKADVVRDIARTAADRQRIVLPLLVVPYTLSQTEEKETLDDSGQRRIVRTEKTMEGAVRLLPDATEVTTAPVLSEKHRGLYRVLTWNGTLAMTGRFNMPAQFGLKANGRVTWGTPHFVLGISDPRGLVGMALALFFVVLVAAAQHIGFVPAYVVAAGACVSLIVAYLWAALASPRIASAVGALLASLYAVMFGLLRSEDHALLAGALFLFGLLAAVMLGTRRVNWYALAKPATGGAG